MWPSWQFALQFALVIFAVVGALALTRPLIPRTRGPLALAIEVGRMFLLYALWQFTKERTVTRQAGAVENARSLWHLEQWLHLPSELALQRAFTPHRWLISMMNAYYGIAHVPVMGGVLVWLYWRHRDRYPTVRNVLFATTLVSVLLHMRPLAPPRMMTDLGFIDSALLMHQSVYGGGGGVSNEVAALPSLHYAWAIIAAIAVVRFSTSRWRWLILIHPILTALSVTSTANMRSVLAPAATFFSGRGAAASTRGAW